MQKINLIKPDQNLLGTRETNSRGFQTTSQSPMAATSGKSLKSVLRNAFENMQKNRAERIRAASAKNTIQKQTVTQASRAEQTQDPSKETLKDPIIVPVSKTQSVNGPQIPNIINNTVILAKSETIKANQKEAGPTAEKMIVDKSFNKDREKQPESSQEDLNNEIGVVTMEVANEQPVSEPKDKNTHTHTHEDKSDDELSH